MRRGKKAKGCWDLEAGPCTGDTHTSKKGRGGRRKGEHDLLMTGRIGYEKKYWKKKEMKIGIPKEGKKQANPMENGTRRSGGGFQSAGPQTLGTW